MRVALYQYSQRTVRGILTDHLPRPVRKMICGKTAEWIQMPFGMVSGIDRGMGVLDGVGDRRREWAVLGVNLGRPFVTNGILLHSCVEVREPIELSFGVVSVVGPGAGVSDGSRRATRGMRGFGRFPGVFSLICLNGTLLSTCIRLVCEKLTIFPYVQ